MYYVVSLAAQRFFSQASKLHTLCLEIVIIQKKQDNFLLDKPSRLIAVTNFLINNFFMLKKVPKLHHFIFVKIMQGMMI